MPGQAATYGLESKPWDHFASLRRGAPVQWVPGANMYYVYGYNEARTALTDPSFSVEYPFRVSRQAFGETLLDLDGPRHASLRRHLGSLLIGRQGNMPFTAQVESCVTTILETIEKREQIDFVPDVATALPRLVTAEFTGISKADRDWVMDYVDYLVMHLDGSSGNFKLTTQRSRELQAFIEDMIRSRPHEALHGGGAVIDRLATSVRSAEIDLGDAVGMVMLIFAAGVKTSSGLLANTMYAISQAPEWSHAAVAGNVSWSQVVVEAARWEPPQMDTVRFAKVDTTLGGEKIAAGKALKVLIGSANRDESVFNDADAFRPGRPERATLGFGVGPHSCLGMHLAIQVSASFFKDFFARFPDAKHFGELAPVTGGTFRMPGHLSIRLRTRSEEER